MKNKKTLILIISLLYSKNLPNVNIKLNSNFLLSYIFYCKLKENKKCKLDPISLKIITCK